MSSGRKQGIFAGQIHVAPDGEAGGTDFGSKLNNWTRRIYLMLIFVTIGGCWRTTEFCLSKKPPRGCA